LQGKKRKIYGQIINVEKEIKRYLSPPQKSKKEKRVACLQFAFLCFLLCIF